MPIEVTQLIAKGCYLICIKCPKGYFNTDFTYLIITLIGIHVDCLLSIYPL